MPLFGRRRARPSSGGPAQSRGAQKAAMEELREFAATRRGVEAYVEPATSLNGTTLLLVAHDGEWTRRQVTTPDAAASFARKLKIPVYDTNRVGYPQRMRDYNVRAQGKPRTRSPFAATGTASAPEPPAPAPVPSAYSSPRERAAIATLEDAAGVPAASTPADEESLRKVFKRARAASHPDRFDGDRARWDVVEQAGRVLGL